MMGDFDRQDIGFGSQSTPFDQIIDSSNLPTIIRYDATQEVDPNLIGPGFDPAQVYLLHSTHEVQRVLARSARFQSSSRSFEDSGLDVTVDQQYDGWFAVFGNPSDHRCDPVVPHFRSIGKLSISPCETFLVSGTQPLEAMKVSRSADNNKSLDPFHILPGAVLTKVGMYTVSLKIKVKKSRFNTKIVDKDETYLACRDELQNEMLIPCHASGIFYVISQVSGQIKTPILKMEDILTRYRFPLLVKLVHGQTVEKPSSCNGTLILLKSHQMNTTFASTLYSPKPATIEIAADSSLRFYNLNSSHNFDLEITNSGSAISKAYQNYSDKMPALLQTIRFRCNEQGVTSARSSSTSGHGSGLSDDEDKFDWSRITVCSNSPFIESVEKYGMATTLFTHLVPTPPTNFQTQISSGKDTKNKTTPKLKKQLSKETTVATTIKKTTMYETPKTNPETIPIIRKQSASSENDASNDETLKVRYENTQMFTSSPVSPTAVSPVSDIDSPTEYCPLWSDASSVTSGESMEVVVENVTHTDVSGNIQDASSSRENTNLSSELAATVRLRNKSRKSLSSILNANDEAQGIQENTYDVLSDNPDRHTIRASYHKLLQPFSVTAPESPDTARSCANDGEGATGPLDTGGIQRGLSINSNGTYEDPTYERAYDTYERPDSNYVSTDGAYERPRGNTYERPRDLTWTGTYEKPKNANYDLPRTGTYVKPQAMIYDRPTSGAYVMPTPQNYDEPGNDPGQQHNDSYQDDGIIYECLDNVYESIVDLDIPPVSSLQYYGNTSKASVYMHADDQLPLTSISSSNGVYGNINGASSPSKPTKDNGLYLNSPPPAIDQNQCNNDILEKLLSNIKSLGLKAATEDAIRSVDPQKFDFNPREETNVRNRLTELFPVMNKIDLNKVSLFVDGSLNS